MPSFVERPGDISNVTILTPLESIPVLASPGNLDQAVTHIARR
jgi:hypothetical protein